MSTPAFISPKELLRFDGDLRKNSRGNDEDDGDKQDNERKSPLIENFPKIDSRGMKKQPCATQNTRADQKNQGTNCEENEFCFF